MVLRSTDDYFISKSLWLFTISFHFLDHSPITGLGFCWFRGYWSLPTLNDNPLAQNKK